MYARLMTMVLAVILVCVLSLVSIFWFASRNNYISTRMEELKVQAYDLAYMASRVRNNTVAENFMHVSTTADYIKWKVNRIYNDFSAYAVVVDRTGQTTVYITPDMLETEMVDFDRELVVSTLRQVLTGQEIVTSVQSESGPMFTVAVPWIDNGTVLGAVFVQTAAQTVYSGFHSLIWQVVLAALIVMICSALVVLLITRPMIRPLKQMAAVSREMAEGRFGRRVPESGSLETRELAHAFNIMATQLDELEQTRKDFIANVSHELRSPMTSIQGYLQCMADGTIDREEQGRYMQIVLDETKRLSRLVGNLLNLSRMENGTTELALSDFDIHESIRRVIIANMTQLDEKNMEPELTFGGEPLYAHADAEQIYQVLTNLLSNAVKYTQEGGKITLGTRVEDKLIHVTVADNGPGIAP